MMPASSFKEEQHPRAKGGLFTSKGGSGPVKDLPPKLADNVDKALSYFPPDHFKNIELGLSTGGQAWATAKANRILLHSDLAKEHPAFVAAILHHEMVHQGQDFRTMNSNQREYDAHSKTARWVLLQIAKSKDPKEKRALQSAYKDASEQAGAYARLRYR